MSNYVQDIETECGGCYSYEESHILSMNDGICETCRVERGAS